MSLDVVEGLLLTELKDFWTKTVIEEDNEDFLPTPGVPFLRPTVELYDSKSISFKCVREQYLFTIQVLIPYGSRDKSFSSELYTHFIEFEDGYLTCKSGRIERVGREKQWYIQNVLIEVEYDNHL